MAVVPCTAKRDIVDFTRTCGPVKPVNSVGQPPLLGFTETELFRYLTEAKVTYSRLHDVGGAFGKNVFVDIPNIFRDFNADENDPASYDFAFTDILLNRLKEAGVEPFYRLGVTIENGVAIKSYRIGPPADYAKWARICEHIIMHYNYGWAEGFNMGITHWEIWNEPDNSGDVHENQMWSGTWEQFMELYGVASTYLKSRFPELMIGGYASCGFYAITGEGVKAANSSPRLINFVDCFLAFMEEASSKKWPLDFFSFHSYSAVPDLKVQIAYARKMLDQYGFKQTKMSVNEWLPDPKMEKLGTAQQAAEIASAMILFQNGPVDDAEIYDARATGGLYSALFAPEIYKPRKAYYSFSLFGYLKELGSAVELPDMPEGVYACAATDNDGKAAIMISNISGKDWKNNLSWPGYAFDEAYLIDGRNDMASVAAGKTRIIRNNSVLLIKLTRK